MALNAGRGKALPLIIGLSICCMAECENCGAKSEKNWDFCPACGESLSEAAPKDIFYDIFKQFEQEFASVNKVFEKQMEAFDISPIFRKPKGMGQGSGFTINIVSSGNRPPQVSIKTFGAVNEKKLKQQVYSQLGEVAERPFEIEEGGQPKTKAYKITEEPKTNVAKAGDKVLVEMELPDVKKGSDIQINELESSVEVKAVAGRKAFFKILKKPENRKITKTGFSKGVLKLELG